MTELTNYDSLPRCLTCKKPVHLRVDGRWHHVGKGKRSHEPAIDADKKEWRVAGRRGTFPDDPRLTTQKMNMHTEILLSKTRFLSEPVTVCDHIGELRIERLLCGCARHTAPCNGWLYSCLRHGGRAREPQPQNLQARAAREMVGAAT